MEMLELAYNGGAATNFFYNCFLSCLKIFFDFASLLPFVPNLGVRDIVGGLLWSVYKVLLSVYNVQENQR